MKLPQPTDPPAALRKIASMPAVLSPQCRREAGISGGQHRTTRSEAFCLPLPRSATAQVGRHALWNSDRSLCRPISL